MKLFFNTKRKKEVQRLKRLEKSNSKRMTDDEFHKIEYAERISDNRRSLFISIIALLFSLVSLVLKLR